jgi:hypothetical protein
MSEPEFSRKRASEGDSEQNLKRPPQVAAMSSLPSRLPASVAPGYRSDDLDQPGLAQLHEALELILDKADYLEAQRRVPFLVATESPLIRFLRCENFDPSAAAPQSGL